MGTSSKTRRLNCLWGALGVLALALALAVPVRTQEPLRWSRNVSGDSTPIFLAADDITTWSEQGHRTFLLKGPVWITQGGRATLRFQNGVVWVDEAGKKKSGVYHLVIFGEGEVQVEEGIKKLQGETGQMEISTRGEIRVKSANGKVVQTPTPDDPLLLRALASHSGAAAPPQIQRTSTAPASTPTPEVAPLGIGGQPTLPAPVPFPAGMSQPAPTGPTPAPVPFPGTAAAPLTPVGSPTLPVLFPATAAQPVPPANASTTSTSMKVAADTPPQNPIQQTQWVPDQPGAAPPPPPVVPAPAAPPAMAPSAPAPVTGPPGTVRPETLPTPKAVETVPGLSGSGPRQIILRPRSSSQNLEFRSFPTPNGETAYVFSSGVILTVSGIDDGKNTGAMDIEADRMVFWSKGDTQGALQDLQSGQGQPADRSLEFYFSGNVELRSQGLRESRILHADEVYYDVNRHVAVAYHADLELQEPGLVNPLHMKADQMYQLNPNLYETTKTEIYTSVLPADPGLEVAVTKSTLEIKQVIKRTIFGTKFINRQTGEPISETQRYFKSDNAIVWLEGIPVWYAPRLQGDADDPLGPLQNFNFGFNKIFGAQFFTTWNMYDLIGINSIPGTKWRLDLDYMSNRGPAAGSVFDFGGNDLFGFTNRYQGQLKIYGIDDHAPYDILGGGRGQFIPTNASGGSVPVFKPDFRGRILDKLNMQDMDNGFSAQAQLSWYSDKNFLEQFYAPEFQTGLNQETFAYVKQQQDYWAWTLLAEDRIRPWVTETNWLPKADGYLLGLKFFDNSVTYNVRADGGFAELKTTNQAPFAYLPTDQNVNTGRFDVIQDASIPLQFGDFKVVPYGVFDMTYYTQDLAGNDIGRIYGGGGVRASFPLSRLYPTIQSDFFNVNGINHKIVFSANYYNAQSNVSLFQLPQLDRINDDASDQALRDLRFWQMTLNPSNATTLTTSPIYNPQIYALQRLVLGPVDTRDTIQVLQLGGRQRWQTKRGYPGQQHIIDWMTLDVTGSLFPTPNHDGFGPVYGFLEYDWMWHIGDRTSLVSTGFFEPFDNAPNMFTFGATTNRPDRTQVYLGYRQIDPLNSKAVIGSVSYAFSPKYAMTASSLYDFGVHNQVNSIMLTRIGTDVQLSVGFSYNSILNNFNFSFMIMPNLVAGRFMTTGLSGGGFMGSTAPGR